MMLEKYLNLNSIKASLTATNKEDALIELAGDKQIVAALVERETLESTAIQNGVAIPHAKVNNLATFKIIVGRSHAGIDFDSHDGKPTNLFFVLLAPGNASGEHIKVLARLAKILSLKGLKEKLLEAPDAKGIYDTLIEADKK